LTTRYDFNPQFAVRATVSNGFRAPSLANSLFSARSTTYGVVDGVYQSINYGVLPVGSGAAQALGAQELKPERSTNFSLGFTLTPTDRLSFTADAYVINLRDRITLTGTLLGSEITQVLQGNGINSTSGGQYFINGADTRTKGLDLVSNYSQDLGQYGAVKWTAAFNWNQTRILNYKESTNILGTSYELMNREARNRITGVQPSTKLILGGDWSIDRFNVNLALTRYGSYTATSRRPGQPGCGRLCQALRRHDRTAQPRCHRHAARRGGEKRHCRGDHGSRRPQPAGNRGRQLRRTGHRHPAGKPGYA